MTSSVVDLHDHACLPVALLQEVVQVDHGDLDEIGRRSWMGALMGGALGELANGRVSELRDLGDVAPAVQQRADVLSRRAFLEDLSRNLRPAMRSKIVVDVFLGLGLAIRALSRARRGSSPVDAAEVDDLARLDVGADHLGKDAEKPDAVRCGCPPPRRRT